MGLLFRESVFSSGFISGAANQPDLFLQGFSFPTVHPLLLQLNPPTLSWWPSSPFFFSFFWCYRFLQRASVSLYIIYPEQDSLSVVVSISGKNSRLIYSIWLLISLLSWYLVFFPPWYSQESSPAERLKSVNNFSIPLVQVPNFTFTSIEGQSCSSNSNSQFTVSNHSRLQHKILLWKGSLCEYVS